MTHRFDPRQFSMSAPVEKPMPDAVKKRLRSRKGSGTRKSPGASRSGHFIHNPPYAESAKASAECGRAAAVVLLMARYEAGLVADEWVHIRSTTTRDFGFDRSAVTRGLKRLAGVGLVELRGVPKGKALQFRLVTSRPPGKQKYRNVNGRDFDYHNEVGPHP